MLPPDVASATATCSAMQTTLDRTACDVTLQYLSACNTYNACYLQAATAYNNTWYQVCPDQANLGYLREEYYAILRINCLVTAIQTASSTSVSLATSLQVCNAKTMDSPDYAAALQIFNIDACHNGWPVETASSNYYCKNLMNLQTYATCAGSPMYAGTYYSNLAYPAVCTASCCVNPPSNYLPVDMTPYKMVFLSIEQTITS